MKLQFEKQIDVQPAVSPAQREVRTAPHKRLPVFEILFLFAVLSMASYGAYHYLHMKDVYAYGVVAGSTEQVVAPKGGVVADLHVERGIVVKKGDLLCRLVPQVTEQERAASAQLADTLRQRQAQLDGDQENLADQAQCELDRLTADYQEDVTAREHAVAVAQLEVEKLRAFHGAKKQLYKMYAEMLAEDATVQANVVAARNEMELAAFNLKQAEADLKLAKARLAPSKAALEKAALEAKRMRTSPGSAEVNLELAKNEMDIASQANEPVEFHAPFDGVVLDVPVTNGTLVTQDKTLVSMAATEGVWIDAYLPLKTGASIRAGQDARIYVPGAPGPVTGEVGAEIRTALTVPDVLASYMPSERAAIYARVSAPEAQLLPGTIVRLVLEKNAARS